MVKRNPGDAVRTDTNDTATKRTADIELDMKQTVLLIVSPFQPNKDNPCNFILCVSELPNTSRATTT